MNKLSLLYFIVFTLFCNSAMAISYMDTSQLVEYIENNPEYVEEVDTTEKFQIIRNLHPKAMKNGKQSYRNLITRILMSTKSEELYKLKVLIDNQNNPYDAEHLIYQTIRKSNRLKLLKYFKEQAKTIRTKIHLLSDIDDTLICNYKDKRFPKKITYPGVLTFHRLFEGSTFITARPKLRGIFERNTHHHFNQINVPKRSILMGSFKALLGRTRMARKKLQNMKNYLSIFPEYHFIWVGDNGQGDQKAGEMLLKTFPKRAITVLIHNIKKVKSNKIGRLASRNIFLFNTYVKAAFVLFKKNILSFTQLQMFIKKSKEDFSKIKFWSKSQKTQAEKLLVNDILSIKNFKGK